MTTKKKTPTIYRQGDVLLMRIADDADAGTEVPRDSGRVVLAYGEVTGHAHAIASPDATYHEMVEIVEGRRILRALGEVKLEHEEHSPITIQRGTYLVVRQREYDPLASRMVAD